MNVSYKAWDPSLREREREIRTRDHRITARPPSNKSLRLLLVSSACRREQQSYQTPTRTVHPSNQAGQYKIIIYGRYGRKSHASTSRETPAPKKDNDNNNKSCRSIPRTRRPGLSACTLLRPGLQTIDQLRTIPGLLYIKHFCSSELMVTGRS